MSRRTQPAPERTPLTRERIIDAAVALADEGGIQSLSMRRLGKELGVEAMSLYYHVANKEELLSGMLDVIFGEIGLPSGRDWREAMRRRAYAARAVFRKHRWAIGLMESQEQAGEATFRHLDAVIGILSEAGFSNPLIGHAYALLDSYIYGFVLQENAFPFEGPVELKDMAGTLVEAMPEGAYPHLVRFTREHVLQPGYDFAREFEVGLELVLDGLEGRRRGQGGPPPHPPGE